MVIKIDVTSFTNITVQIFAFMSVRFLNLNEESINCMSCLYDKYFKIQFNKLSKPQNV